MEKMLRDLIAAEPSITQAQAAFRLGLTRQRVSQLCRQYDIKMADGRKALRLGPPRSAPNTGREYKHLNHFGHDRQRHNAVFIGGACEMTVVSDLLRRGIHVYRSITYCGPFDLVANYEGKLYRIEVKAATRKENGGLSHGPPQGGFDVLALVTPDAAITYRPIPGCDWPQFES